jgi:hypothetical protein
VNRRIDIQAAILERRPLVLIAELKKRKGRQVPEKIAAYREAGHVVFAVASRFHASTA